MFFFLRLLFLYLSFDCSGALQCLDENSSPVDWFVVYKLPKIKNKGKLIAQGVSYTYMTSNDDSSWKLSNNSITSSDSIIANTLGNLYSSKNNYTYILYNDEPPNIKSKSNKGHTKGVVMVNKDGGFWLVHSVPKFPDTASHSYSYPETGKHYGQSFLCISLNLENLNKVGLQLQYNEPEIYEKNLLTSISAYIPELENAAKNVTVDKAPWFHMSNIDSTAGVAFISFAKAHNFNKDLYVDLVAAFLKTDLLVETWADGPGRLRSNCSQIYKVNNVESVSIMTADVSFKSTHDHSKWAVSCSSNDKTWVCVGDINRAEHQEMRGGGTVCFNNKQIVKNYQKLVKSVENCNDIL